MRVCMQIWQDDMRQYEILWNVLTIKCVCHVCRFRFDCNESEKEHESALRIVITATMSSVSHLQLLLDLLSISAILPIAVVFPHVSPTEHP